MINPLTILLAEDDDGHAGLITRNLRRAGLQNPIIRFEDGQGVLDYLFSASDNKGREDDKPYLLLLDIRMPRVDGFEVLARLKSDPDLKKMPIIVLTTTDNPSEIQDCYELGCNNYIKKPVEYEQFISVIKHLGLFLAIVEIPVVSKS